MHYSKIKQASDLIEEEENWMANRATIVGGQAYAPQSLFQ